MQIQGQAALVTGGGSGLGEATARELARLGARVAVLDVNLANAQKVATDIGGVACQCDITDSTSLQAAIDTAAAAHGPARILGHIAGIGAAKRVVGKDGNAAPLEDFARVINVNLIGTYNAARLFAAACARLDPLEDGERGVMVLHRQRWPRLTARWASRPTAPRKAGVAGMTLPMARDLAQHGIRVCTIAPGLFSHAAHEAPCPNRCRRRWRPASRSRSAWASPRNSPPWPAHIVTNTHLNGEVIRLDGALRMAPR
jgi:NAD(P)-dependent dehydrogenase (short-subunit alcohol dehydrogenase family)